jgi:hypothetical protein
MSTATATKSKTAKTAKTDQPVSAGPISLVPAVIPTTDNVLAMALAKKFPSDGIIENRAKIPVGDHPFKGEFVVTLDGVLRKGKDFEQHISNKIDWMLAFAVVASMLNETSMKHAMKLINVAHRSQKNHPEKTVELVARVKNEVEAKIAWLKKSTLRPMDGKITFPELQVKIEEV